MGFDISYHPMSKEQMNAWYFSRLEEVEKGNYETLEKISQEANMEPFYIEKYKGTISTAVEILENELFEKAHVYMIAVIQGFFLPYYYTRGTGFSFLIQQVQKMREYTTSWNELKPSSILNSVSGGITENYCGGVFMAPDQVGRLLADYENNHEIREIISNFFEENLPVFLKALNFAKDNQLGLLEATEVVEPNPTNLNETISYSNLMHCDQEGALIYEAVALRQIANYLQAKEDATPPEEVLANASYNKITPSKEKEKGGFFRKLFKK